DDAIRQVAVRSDFCERRSIASATQNIYEIVVAVTIRHYPGMVVRLREIERRRGHRNQTVTGRADRSEAACITYDRYCINPPQIVVPLVPGCEIEHKLAVGQHLTGLFVRCKLRSAAAK